MRIVALALLGLLLALPGWALEGRVVRVSDGDSLWLRPAAGGRSLRVRLQGIDAPEICQAGGDQARRALEALVLNRTVELQPQGHDDYGRTLARVRVAGPGASFDVGARLVADGAAWSYRYRDDLGPYRAEELRAIAARRGLHAHAPAVLPREFRRTHGPCK
ncbi:MAG TPA: thermonuclease family protein [Ideonella sp.]|nr:thermonuclease family protein [Ideonella sp.]